MTTTLRGDDNFDTKDVLVGVAKAWVNFNGTGAVAIRSSFNVSSITDGGVGAYTINFANPLADANYSAQLNRVGASASSSAVPGAFLASSLSLLTYSGGTQFDPTTVTATIQGN